MAGNSNSKNNQLPSICNLEKAHSFIWAINKLLSSESIDKCITVKRNLLWVFSHPRSFQQKSWFYWWSNKVIVYKSCGQLSLSLQCATFTFGLAQSCDFKNLKFMKQNPNKKNTRTLNCPIGPNQPKSKIMLLKESPPQDFIRKTLLMIAGRNRTLLWEQRKASSFILCIGDFWMQAESRFIVQ